MDDGSMIRSRRTDSNNFWYRQDIRGSVTALVKLYMTFPASVIAR